MNLYKKVRRALLLGLGLLTIYTTNVNARDDYHLTSMQQQDSGADTYSSFFDKPAEMKNIFFAFDVGSLRGDLNVKTNSDMKLNSTSLKMDFGDLFSPNIQGFDMYSDDRNFKVHNVSKIGSKATLEEKVSFDKDFGVKDLSLNFNYSRLNVFYKLLNEENRKGNINYFGFRPFEGASVGYGISSINGGDEKEFYKLDFSKKGFGFSAFADGGESMCLRNSFVGDKLGYLASYKMPEDVLEVVLSYKPSISSSDMNSFDESSFRDSGNVNYSSLKGLRSFTNKGIAVKYYKKDDLERFEGAWNFLNFDYQFERGRLKASSWVDVSYDNLSKEIKESINADLSFNNLKFTGSVNDKQEFSVGFSYETKF